MKRGKLILYIAISLDGFIARENGAIDWLQGQGDVQEPDFGYEAFIAEIDTVVMGWTTYHQIVTELSPEAWVYPQQKTLIVTNRKLELADKQYCVNVNDIVAEVEREVQQGRNVWLVGGAKTIEPFLASNVIDEYVITVMPTILGSGIRLFTETLEQPLRLIKQEVIDGMVMLTYHRR
ncbi:MAG: dihydrofolate reductase family protein [Culicoidibacterales bacterium]